MSAIDNGPAGYSWLDILNALERQAAALQRQADQLGAQLDYSAEFPGEDAERLREAAQLIRASGTALDVVQAVQLERVRQDEKWGGPKHDDSHPVATWVQLIQDYAGWARVMGGMGDHHRTRRRLVQVAALAIAACEVLDRQHDRALMFCRVCDALRGLYGPDALVGVWIEQPQPLLGGKTPRSLIMAGQGQHVLDAVRAAGEGNHA